MGLLDDAIREHLELKRKHGADPEDVARQENEALGPGQRNEFAQPAAEDEPTPPPAAYEPEPPAPPPPAAEEDDALPEGEPGIPEEPTAEHPAAAPGYDEDPWLEEEADEVPAEDALEAHQRPQPPAGEEDVLEETPEFLQETPEHDRLWFEQKPPRDFDWDK
jgi:hypothetical protein